MAVTVKRPPIKRTQLPKPKKGPGPKRIPSKFGTKPIRMNRKRG